MTDKEYKREKLIKQLFIGKVADEIGLKRTTQLLKESTEEIDLMIKKNIQKECIKQCGENHCDENGCVNRQRTLTNNNE